MIRRPPRSTLSSSSAASDVYKRQGLWYGTWRAENGCWWLEWSEKLSNNRGQFMYQGKLLDGGMLRGTFYWSMIPRKSGTFEFNLARLQPGYYPIKPELWQVVRATI
eukprot:TRINITY_DN4851_c0_g3_i2.p1 TRINITY_DN4851_c0_g3~~TRINITY_DN4851_c0_g3_i2.p1  ORF type:complete len:107 (+),score=21.75 TRINITY_DN4851_c0_g3_i2:92-412(+)